MLTSSQQHTLKRCLDNDQPIPRDIADQVLIECGLLNGLSRRNQLIREAAALLTGSLKSRSEELSVRVESLGEVVPDHVDDLLTKAQAFGRLPRSWRRIFDILRD